LKNDYRSGLFCFVPLKFDCGFTIKFENTLNSLKFSSTVQQFGNVMIIRIIPPQRHFLVLTDLTCQLICPLENSRAKAHSVFKCFVSPRSSSSYVSNCLVSVSHNLHDLHTTRPLGLFPLKTLANNVEQTNVIILFYIDSPNCVTKFAPNFFLVRDGSSASKSPRDHAFPTRDIKLGPSTGIATLI
jgi:hypothetical protein